MLFSGKWFDPVIGIDIHLIQPPGPVPPVPVPHPFIGIVYDPAGLMVGMAISAAVSGLFGGSFSGPVLINGMPAANTGMQVKGMPVHVPIGGTFVYPPSNEGTIITGSKTVHVLGTSGARLTSMVITCNDPINLPTSVVMSIPMGAPVFTGGPTAVDWLAVALSAIRTKWVSDKLHDIFKAKPGSWRSKIICLLTGHPVDVATGRVLTSHVDFTLAGPVSFKFERHYYSASTHDGPLGRGWSHSYDQYVAIKDSSIVLHSEDGRDIEFDYVTDGEQIYDSVEQLTLERQADYILVRTPTRRLLTFQKLGSPPYRLIRIADLNGYTLSLAYDKGLLRSIADSLGRVVDLYYDSERRLIGLEAPHPDHQSARIVVAEFTYNDLGELVSVADALGSRWTYSYANGLLASETDPNGLSFYFVYDGTEPDSRCIHTWGDGGIYNQWLTYEPSAGLTIVQDSRGAKTTYFSNTDGLVTKIIDALGGVRKLEWDENCRKIREEDPNGCAFTYSYHTSGALQQIVDPLGSTHTFKYDELRCLTEYADPNGATRRYAYDTRGNLVSHVDELGGEWRYTIDARGIPTKIAEPNGRIIDQWRSKDQRSVVISDADGLLLHADFDTWGRPTLVEDRTGRAWRYIHDLRGKLVTRIDPDGLHIEFEYDKRGNLIAFKNRLGGVSQYRYGGLNKIVQTVDAGGNSVRYEYEPIRERLVRVVNERGETLVIDLDLLSRPVSVIGFDGAVTRFDYDAGGRRTRMRLADESMITYAYDAANRLIEWCGSDGSFARYVYDLAGMLIEAVNEDGRIRRYHNKAGYLELEDQNGIVVQYGYDYLGQRLWRINDVTQRAVRYTYDDLGRLTKISDDLGMRQTFIYDRLSRLIRRDFSGGAFEQYEYNIHGKVSLHTVVDGGGQCLCRRTYSYDAVGSIKEVRNLEGDTTAYDYTANQQLDAARENDVVSEKFEYDATGNLRYSSSLGTLEYAPGNRLLEAGSLEYVYNAAGRLSEVRGGGQNRALSYDAAGRLRSVQSGNGSTIRYSYDALGRRTIKNVDGATTRFVWDEMTLMLEKADVSPVTEYAFVPGFFFPLTQWNGEAHYHYVLHPAGLPLEMLDGRGDLAWRGAYSTFGALISATANGARNPLRLQGQYEDAETGLHYNLYRYYDPLTSRYITPDPFGLLGSLNTYEYGLNPLNWMDPFGLMARPSGSPSPAIRQKLQNGDFGDTCRSCGRQTVGPDAVAKAQAEHMFPDSKIRQMDGFNELAKADQQAVRNLEDNFTNLCDRCNPSRGNKPYTDWQGHPELPPQPGALESLAKEEAEAAEKIKAEIEARKSKPATGCG